MIPVFKPLLEQEEFAAAQQALELGWLGMGSYVSDFERGIHDLISDPMGDPGRHVVAVSTGHAALHLALLLIGCGPGDEVITPSFNNIADFQAILATGAEPVFCDIDDKTLCIDLDKAEELVGPRTKAMIVMDYDCVLCDHDRVADFQQRHGIRIIHDAAHALGSKYKGRPVGSFSDITMFSFDPVKTITCIDGGALIVRSPEEMEILHEMRLIGMGQPSKLMYQNQRAWTYDVKRLGFRYHMANMHAAIGLAQLGKLDRISTTRRETARYYNQQFRNVPGVVVPQTDFEDVTPFLYYIRVPAEQRDALRAHLREQGIDTGIHWQPGHWFSLLKDFRRGDLSVTDKVGKEVLSLPLHSAMDSETRQRVVDGVSTFFGAAVAR
jgi:dTDP-4-amino-4,6-dideoxygalactose transaminase